jgi:hypothetical protein
MHPLVASLSNIKDSELETKISDLTRKYFSTNNPDVRHQITMVLDSYKDELSRRQQEAYKKMVESRNKDLDKLIKVN